MVDIASFLLYLKFSLILKLVVTFKCVCHAHCAGDFIMALTLLPTIIYVMVVLMGNGINANITITNTFDLMHFHSMPKATGRVYALFLTVNAKLVYNVKCLNFTILFAMVLYVVFIICAELSFNSGGGTTAFGALSIAVPRSLSCARVFSSVFGRCASRFSLAQIGAAGVNDLFGLACGVALGSCAGRGRVLSGVHRHGKGLRVDISGRRAAVDRLW